MTNVVKFPATNTKRSPAHLRMMEDGLSSFNLNGINNEDLEHAQHLTLTIVIYLPLF